MDEKKALVLTGRLCAKPLHRLVDPGKGEILELPIEVAALMNPEIIRHQLLGLDLTGYDYVMVPGALKFDLEMLESQLGLPFYLGPTHYVDVPMVLENLDKSQLSKTSPADLVLKDLLRNRTRDFYRSAESTDLKSEIVIGKGKGSIPIGGSLPPRIVGEIVDAPGKDVYEILTEAKHLARSGASIIDIGMVPGRDDLDFIDVIVPLIKRDLDVPVSVDTLREEEILAAADAGADLILSICGSTLDIVPSLDLPVVIVPLESVDSARPKSGRERLEMITRFACKLHNTEIIADPLLEPLGLGFSRSIGNYLGLGECLPDTPFLMGVGNVTELADADSIGMNALLAGIAVETKASLLLNTENSPKTRGSTGELRAACEMMYYAVQNQVPPKNLGLNLLRFKEKVSRDFPVNIPRERVLVDPFDDAPASLDGGIFHITILNSKIHAIFRGDNREVDIIGSDADAIVSELESQGILPGPRHSFYLGSELKKAEIALRTGRSYVQDELLFEGSDENEKDKD